MLEPPIEQAFESFEAAHEHINHTGMQQGYRPIRMRSSKGKSAYYACHKGREASNRVPEEQRRRQTSTRAERTGCPFAVYVGYRKDGLWHLEVREGHHNHPAEEFAGLKLRDLPNSQRERVRQEILSGIKPGDVLARLQLEIGQLNITIRDIYNEAARLKRDSRKDGEGTDGGDITMRDEGDDTQFTQGNTMDDVELSDLPMMDNDVSIDQSLSFATANGSTQAQSTPARGRATVAPTTGSASQTQRTAIANAAAAAAAARVGGGDVLTPGGTTASTPVSTASRRVGKIDMGADKPTMEKTLAQFLSAYGPLPESMRDEAVRKLQFLVVDLQKQAHRIDLAKQRDERKRQQDAEEMQAELAVLRAATGGQGDGGRPGGAQQSTPQNLPGQPYTVPPPRSTLNDGNAGNNGSAQRGGRRGNAGRNDPSQPTNPDGTPMSANLFEQSPITQAQQQSPTRTFAARRGGAAAGSADKRRGPGRPPKSTQSTPNIAQQQQQQQQSQQAQAMPVLNSNSDGRVNQQNGFQFPAQGLGRNSNVQLQQSRPQQGGSGQQSGHPGQSAPYMMYPQQNQHFELMITPQRQQQQQQGQPQGGNLSSARQQDMSQAQNHALHSLGDQAHNHNYLQTSAAAAQQQQQQQQSQQNAGQGGGNGGHRPGTAPTRSTRSGAVATSGR